MSTLTKTERDGLEDVFLSIHVNHSKYYGFKEIVTLIMSHKKYISVRKFLKQASYGIKKRKILTFFNFFNKKKKNLSK